DAAGVEPDARAQIVDELQRALRIAGDDGDARREVAGLQLVPGVAEPLRVRGRLLGEASPLGEVAGAQVAPPTRDQRVDGQVVGTDTVLRHPLQATGD